MFDQYYLEDGTINPAIVQDGADAVVKNGLLRSPNYTPNKSGYMLDPQGNVEFNSAKIRGGANIGFINIPNDTSANSFHVDSNGNTWWGSQTLATATASVLNTGEAVFKNFRAGGSQAQYLFGDSGIFSFGDGSDGAGILNGVNTYSWVSYASGVYTLTRDVYLTDLSISAGITLKKGGYRLFGTGTLTNDGIIERNGNNGFNGGGNGSYHGGAGGDALAAGYLIGSNAGGAGGDGGRPGGINPTAGSDTTSVLNSLGSDARPAGNGGQGYGLIQGGPSGVPGTVTISNVKLIANWHLGTLLDISSSGSTVKFTSSPSAPGGGGGGRAATSDPAAGGGGGGSSASIMAIYFKKIVNNGIISADGGKGGDGGFGGVKGNGGGGGGAGGNGGDIILVYNELINNGIIRANAGKGGIGGDFGTTIAGGAAVGFGTAGENGQDGNAGNIRLFKISL